MDDSKPSESIIASRTSKSEASAGEEASLGSDDSVCSYVPLSYNDGVIHKNLKEFSKFTVKNDLRARYLFFRRSENAPQCVTPCEKVASTKRRPYEKLIEKSQKDLEELMAVGEELKSNILLEEIKRDAEKMAAKKHQYEQTIKNYLKESREHFARYDEMQSKWTELDFERGDALKVLKETEVFKEDFMKMVALKDEFVNKVQGQYDRLVAQVEVDSSYQSQITKVFSERIDTQVASQRKAHEFHLNSLERTLYQEYRELFDQKKKLYKLYMEKVEDHDKIMQDIVNITQDFFFARIKAMEKREAEIEYRIRVTLDRQFAELVTEMFTIRSESFHRSQKLDYDFGLLNRQLPEYDELLGHMRRNIGQINNKISKLRTELEAKKKRWNFDIQQKKRLVEDLHKRLTRDELQHGKVLRNYHTKFLKMWEMYYLEVMDVLQHLLYFSEKINEYVYYTPWDPPNLDIVKKDLPFACLHFEEERRKADRINAKKIPTPSEKRKIEEENNIKLRLLRNILRVIPNETQDMISAKLYQLYSPFSKTAKEIVSIHRFLNLLQVSSMKDLEVLTACFEKFATATVPKQATEFANNENVPNKIIQIKMNMLPIAVTEFIKDRKEEKLLSFTKSDCTVVYPNHNDLIKFWSPFLEIVPEETEKAWQYIRHSLEHYRVLLKKRESLMQRCECLRKRNAEIKHFLREYC